MVANPRPPEFAAALAAEAAALDARLERLSPQEVIAFCAEKAFPGAVAAVSSFGADSAVLLHMVAAVDRDLPVLFLDTGKHFGETLAYREALAADLGLTRLQVVSPLAGALAEADPDGTLHRADTDACCAVRKVEPMARAVEPFRAWFTGRKRYQSATRRGMAVVEAVGVRMRINPLARWGTAELAGYMRRHALRENPLVAYGYASIGCFPCTRPVGPGEDARGGRWAGSAKTECGIHLTGLEQSLTASEL